MIRFIQVTIQRLFFAIGCLFWFCMILWCFRIGFYWLETSGPFPVGGTYDEFSQKDRQTQIEGLAKLRETLEQEKVKVQIHNRKLLEQVADLSADLDELRENEQKSLSSWAKLESVLDAQDSLNGPMSEAFDTIERQRDAILLNTDDFTKRQKQLHNYVRLFAETGNPLLLESLGKQATQLVEDIQQTSRQYRSLARESASLVEQLNRHSGDANNSDLFAELVEMQKIRQRELKAEYEVHIEKALNRTKEASAKETAKWLAANEHEAIRKNADARLAEFEKEELQRQKELRKKQAVVSLEKDRAKIEHYLVPFIANKRTYTITDVLSGKPVESVWVNIPLEKAASLSDLEKAGVLGASTDSYKQLKYFMNKQLSRLGDECLPSGQNWKSRNTRYLIIATELFKKHGQAMVEAGLLRE